MNEKFITATKLRKNLFENLEQVNVSNVAKIVTKNGLPYATLLSYDKYEDILELIESYVDDSLVKRIEESEKEIREGEYVTWNEYLKEESKVPEFVLRDKTKVTYGANVPDNSNKQGKKGFKKTANRNKK